MMSTNSTPSPGDFARPAPAEAPDPTAGGNPGPTASLEVLESLAGMPVADHLSVYEELHGRLSADLGTTSQEQW